jgi:hypothetical protein
MTMTGSREVHQKLTFRRYPDPESSDASARVNDPFGVYEALSHIFEVSRGHP